MMKAIFILLHYFRDFFGVTEKQVLYREVIRYARLLGQIPQANSIANADLAGIGLNFTGKDFKQSRLAHAIVTDQRKFLPLRYSQGDIFKKPTVIEGLCNIFG